MQATGVASKSAARRHARELRADLTTHLTRPPTKKRNVIKKTEAEKEALAAKRQDKNANYKAALDSARQTILDEAKVLQARFGGHSIEYYTREIIQVSHKAMSQ